LRVTVISKMFMLQKNGSCKLDPGVAELHAMCFTVISIMFIVQQTDAES